jgi:hypothetical protein
MIVTSRFVFLHLHKSGGTFVNECLRRFVPGSREIGYHLPRSRIPEQFASLPALGFVRNPWSYYVSWHAFQSGRPQPNALYRVASEDGRLGFKGTVSNLLDLGAGGAALDRLVGMLPLDYGNRGLNLPGFALAPIAGSGLGFYSYLYAYMFGAADGLLRVGRMETLREALPGMLEATGTEVTGPMREFIAEAPALNATAHAAYAELYDEELREKVAQRDASVIARHGYQFGD